ncbi:Rho GTPase activation protein [Russula compacta]|nr:Rho GTPase activation protein [Russula compacta]
MPLIDPNPDAGRRYVGPHRQSAASINPTLSPTSSPYPLPYYLPRTKFHQNFLNAADPTIPPTDQPSSESSSRHLRHSAPDLIYGHGPRLPSSFSSLHHRASSVTHDARARFVSLPAAVSFTPRIDTECDRLERACGRAPTALLRVRDELPPSSPHQPRGDGPPPSLAPKWPHLHLVLRIKRALRRDGKDIRDYVEAEQINELYHHDVEERARRERERGRMARMRAGQESSDCDKNTHIFGVPLNESILRAPATAILGGYRHDLPLVVFLCVEELYRTGIYKSGLFRDLPNRQRHHELSTLFDTPPAFGEGMSLRAESTADICALLLTYLKDLPEPVLTPCLFNAFWNWSVRPSVKREDERMRKEQDEEEDLRTRFFQTGQRPSRPSRRVLFEKARLRAAQDEAAETGQVAVARDLLRLLPTHSFSLIVYLCAFFTQVPLCPENGITFEDIGRIFGPPIFGGSVPAARRMMVWFLKRWNRVSDGLLDAKPVDSAAALSPPPSVQSSHRPDAICSCSSARIRLNCWRQKSRRKTGWRISARRC